VPLKLALTRNYSESFFGGVQFLNGKVKPDESREEIPILFNNIFVFD